MGAMAIRIKPVLQSSLCWRGLFYLRWVLGLSIIEIENKLF
jgi:hypothetical protein